jgi:hypothetical protein
MSRSHSFLILFSVFFQASTLYASRSVSPNSLPSALFPRDLVTRFHVGFFHRGMPSDRAIEEDIVFKKVTDYKSEGFEASYQINFSRRDWQVMFLFIKPLHIQVTDTFMKFKSQGDEFYWVKTQTAQSAPVPAHFQSAISDLRLLNNGKNIKWIGLNPRGKGVFTILGDYKPEAGLIVDYRFHPFSTKGVNDKERGQKIGNLEVVLYLPNGSFIRRNLTVFNSAKKNEPDQLVFFEHSGPDYLGPEEMSSYLSGW